MPRHDASFVATLRGNVGVAARCQQIATTGYWHQTRAKTGIVIELDESTVDLGVGRTSIAKTQKHSYDPQQRLAVVRLQWTTIEFL